MIERPLPEPTVGERLDAQAKLMLIRREPAFGWAAAFGVLARRFTERSAPFEGRFERVEATPSARGPAPARGAPVTRAPSAHADLPDLAPRGTRSDPPADTPSERLTEDPGPGLPLSADVRRRLRDVSGPGADRIRVHADGAADATARDFDAAAVTIGPDAFFRAGQLRPDDAGGMALLAHETSHVSDLLRPEFARTASGSSAAGPTPGTAAREIRAEASALARERAVLSAAAESPTAARPPSASARLATNWPAEPQTPAAAPAAGHRARVHRAPMDRDPGPQPSSGPDPTTLRRDVVQDLMLQLRTEYERGG